MAGGCMKEAGYVYTVTKRVVSGWGENYTVYSGLESHLIYKGENPEQNSVSTNALKKCQPLPQCTNRTSDCICSKKSCVKFVWVRRDEGLVLPFSC